MRDSPPTACATGANGRVPDGSDEPLTELLRHPDDLSRQNEVVIDLRSDTASKPTPAMREAIASAEVGDEQMREDPTVNELERRAAETLGQEDAVFVPTATMANEIALRMLGRARRRADRRGELAHPGRGARGPAVHAGLMTRPLHGAGRALHAGAGRAAVRRGDLGHVPTTRIVSIENTHNASGGRVWPLAEVDAMVATCRELELSLHLDGSRIFNAAVASGEQPASIAGALDTVTICFSKGLGCPLGAVVAGLVGADGARGGRSTCSAERCARQGSSPRPASTRSITTSSGSRRITPAPAVSARGCRGRRPGRPRAGRDQLRADRRRGARSRDRRCDRAAARRGHRLTPTMRPGVLRAVTHLAITDEDIDRRQRGDPARARRAARV